MHKPFYINGGFVLGIFFLMALVLPWENFLAFADISTAVSDRQAKLQEELDTLSKEIAEQQAILNSKKAESASLERDISILNAKIKEAQLSIERSNVLLERLGKDINQKSVKIETLSERILRNKESLANLLRRSNEIDRSSLTEIVLSGETISQFFADLESYQALKRSLHEVYAEVTTDKNETEAEKALLEKRSREEADARAIILEKRRQIEKNQKEKNALLSTTKNQEKFYELAVKEREKRAAEIRSALFSLRDTAAIPFGTALQYATLAEKKTGVRPAFLLAILTQETNLGQNLGTCNRPGDPPNKGWRMIMKPDRDQEPYLQITSELGLDPNTMPLSCPLKGSGGGWGGAMGPAQFIPSTWKLYQNRLTKAIGKNPNPWEPFDAFMASALLLADLGASKGGYSAEREAALRYYAGGAWNKKSNAFYGNQVLAKATNIQENMIDPLLGL